MKTKILMVEYLQYLFLFGNSDVKPKHQKVNTIVLFLCVESQHRVMIHSEVDYSDIMYSSASSSWLKTLEPVQNVYLGLVLRASLLLQALASRYSSGFYHFKSANLCNPICMLFLLYPLKIYSHIQPKILVFQFYL